MDSNHCDCGLGHFGGSQAGCRGQGDAELPTGLVKRTSLTTRWHQALARVSGSRLPIEWVSLDLVVRNTFGLHARAAAMFVRIANRFQSEILVENERGQVNGKSILGLLTLAAGPGHKLRTRACGLDASQALGELALLVARNFDEG